MHLPNAQNLREERLRNTLGAFFLKEKALCDHSWGSSWSMHLFRIQQSSMRLRKEGTEIRHGDCEDGLAESIASYL